MAPQHQGGVWRISPGQAPVPLGLMPTAQRSAALTLSEQQQQALRGATVAISMEPLGGSSSGLPTGPVLAEGTLTFVQQTD